jgi:hypothetical protein
MISRELYGTSPTGVYTLSESAIAEVKTVKPKYGPRGPYTERQTDYMVKLKGENMWRRVYATPLGNVAVIYLKDGRIRIVHCGEALEEVLAKEE